jgi:hypothetical protein
MVLHGLELPTETLAYMRYLPKTLRFLDLAMSGITDEEMEPIIERCPKIESINLSVTNATISTLMKIAESWGSTIKDLTLPITMAKQLTLYNDSPDESMLKNLAHWIGQMGNLEHIRFGEHRLRMETQWHKSFIGKESLGQIMEQRLIETLERTLPPKVTVHMDPYEDDDDDEYYRKHETQKPNPKFPPKSNPSYVFQTLGRKDETEGTRNTYRNQYTNSRFLSPITRGKREYYLELFEDLEYDYGDYPEGNITVPYVRKTMEEIINAADDVPDDKDWEQWTINDDE